MNNIIKKQIKFKYKHDEFKTPVASITIMMELLFAPELPILHVFLFCLISGFL